MAKIVEAHIEDGEILNSEGESILIAPPTREGGKIWGVLLIVFLVVGASVGASLSGVLPNAIQVTQNAFASDGTSETMTN